MIWHKGGLTSAEEQSVPGRSGTAVRAARLAHCNEQYNTSWGRTTCRRRLARRARARNGAEVGCCISGGTRSIASSGHTARLARPGKRVRPPLALSNETPATKSRDIDTRCATTGTTTSNTGRCRGPTVGASLMRHWKSDGPVRASAPAAHEANVP